MPDVRGETGGEVQRGTLSVMLTSVYESRKDAPLVAGLIALHAPKAEVIVDTTYGGGRFWTREVIGIDRNPQRAHTLCADYTMLPFRDASVDVLAFDPPHIPDSGKPRQKAMGEQYTIVWGQHSIEQTMWGFVWEAVRVLKKNGIVIAKLSDQVERGKKRWQCRQFANMCEEAGLTVCDRCIKVRPRPMCQPWTTQRHVWNRHSEFIVVRKGKC